MHTKTLLATFLLSATVAAIPVPGQNVTITDAEWAALEANGLTQRGIGLQARDKVMNCGKDITGNVSIGGHGVGWVPLNQFNTSMQAFCNFYLTPTSCSLQRYAMLITEN